MAYRNALNNKIDFVAYPDYDNPNWVSYSGTVTTTIAGAGGSTQPINEKSGCTFISAMNYLTELDKTYLVGNHLKGTKTLTTAAATSVVEFDYVLSKE